MTTLPFVLGLSSEGAASFALLSYYAGLGLTGTSSFTIMGLSPKKKSIVRLLSEQSSSHAERGNLKYLRFFKLKTTLSIVRRSNFCNILNKSLILIILHTKLKM
jgi:hypothetical protein